VHLLARHYLGISYDPSYAYVRHLPADCTILDVGANAGQSAIEFARLRPDAKVISFEANPDNLADLAAVRRILGQRFVYHHVALSDRSGSGTLHVPVMGKTPVPGEASLQPELFSEVEERLGKISRVIHYPVALRTLDSYNLTPHLVKIDVQGHELSVLRGMVHTLEQHRPVLIIECGGDFEEVRRILENNGYGLYTYDVSNDRMTRLEGASAAHFFALP
jgi:FkbM family methyltransferase